MKKIIFIFMIILLSGFVFAQNSISSSEIKIGVYVLSIGKFDVGTGSFSADFYLSMNCKNMCPLQDFEFSNGRATSIDKIIDNPSEKFYRIQASLIAPIDLKKFPFDSQSLPIIIEDKKATVEKLNYVVDESQSGIDPAVFFTGWQMGEWSASVDEHYYGPYDETYSRYTFNIPIYRLMFNSILKTFLPIFFIVLVMLSSFFLDPDKITTRLTMVGSALIASVMFHISIANQIPPLGYLTFADKFMIMTYFILLLSFIMNVFMLELYERKKTELVNKIHKKTEYISFIVVAFLYTLLFIFGL